MVDAELRERHACLVADGHYALDRKEPDQPFDEAGTDAELARGRNAVRRRVS